MYSIDTLTSGGNSIEGLILAIAWFAASPQSQQFSQAGKSQWGGEVNWRTAMSFDATQAFIEALSDKASRSEVLENLKNIQISPDQTSGETLKFTENGERQSDPVLVEVIRGKNNPPGSEFGFNLIQE